MSDLLRTVRALTAAACLSMLCNGVPASAHDNAMLAKMAGPHGGILQMSGNFHLELVLSPAAVNVWVTDHSDAPQKTHGATATATLFSGADRTTVELKPVAVNQLTGAATLSATRGLKAVVDLKMPNEEPVQIRFDIPK